MAYLRTAETPTPFVGTYQDAIDHLVDFCDGLTRESDMRRAREAIHSAYRRVGMHRRWRYLKTHARIDLVAPYTTGTIAVSGTTVTLTTGTWPSWARYGTISISGLTPLYRIAERTSDSVITIESAMAPVASVAAGTTYTLFRSQYPLPADMWAMEEINDQDHLSASYATPSEIMALEREYKSSSTPFRWTVTGSSDLHGQMVVWTYGYPASASTIDFIYSRTPRRLILDGKNLFASAGTVTMSGATTSATTCVIANQIIKDEAINSVIRFARPGATSNPAGSTSAVPYYFQRLVTAVTDNGTNSTLTLDAAVPYNPASDVFTISDPLDVSESLYEPFRLACEYNMLLKTDPAKAAQWNGLVEHALLIAREQDATVPGPQTAGWNTWKPGDWPCVIAMNKSVE